MVQGTAAARPFLSSKKDLPSKATSTVCPPPRRNGSSSVQQAKPGFQAKLRAGLPGHQAVYPHLENVDANMGGSGISAANTPCASPWKSKPAKSTDNKISHPLSSTDGDSAQGPSSTGYGGCLSRTSSNVSSSLAASSDEEATTTGASSVSGSDAETNGSLSARSHARRSRRAALFPQGNHELERTPTKTARSAGRTTPAPSPARSLRSGVQRALVLQPQPSLKRRTETQSCFELEENPSFWEYHNVQVVVRARPISAKEATKDDFSRCLRQEGAHAITWMGQPETRFTFDHVAGDNISQAKLFQVVGLPIVENCMAGYNSCMFAYGQTGSGKTHTMLGDITEAGDKPSDNRGMTPRIFEYLFSRIQKEEQDRQLEQLRYVCKCSFLEIYNEQITDLLEPSSSNLQMREDSKKGVYVENLTEKIITNVQDVISVLLKGAANRRVASTNMNRESSRSHSVFTCSVECKWETNSLNNMRFGRLNLVDLAGSERQKSSGAEGGRLKEAASINKSLSTLGLVMMILVDIANGKQRHVPYRDSKLTFLLQDSLGGNSKTAIIATISPSSCCSMETLSTLKFAQRAKFIQNNAVVNEDASGEMLALRREIQQLKNNETDVHTIRHLNETVERLQTELQRKEDLLYGLEFDIRLLQENAAEDHDFKQELLHANSRIFELQAEAQLRREELQQLGTAKEDLEEQLACKNEAMREVEDALLKSRAHVTLVIHESQALNSRVSQLQTRLSTLEAELAERTDALTMECKYKVAALVSQQGEVENLLAERDDLKAQCATLVGNLKSLEGSVAHQVDVLHGEFLVSLMTELFVQELNSDMETAKWMRLESRLREVELQNADIEDELQTAGAIQTTLHNEIQGLGQRLADCQDSNEALNLELAEKMTKITLLRDELSTASGASAQKLKTLETEMRALLTERDALQAEVGGRSSTISFLESEVIVARASAEASSEAFAGLEAKIGTLQAQVVEARKCVEESVQITESLEGENSTLQAQIVVLEAELSCKTTLAVSLETQLATARSSSTAVMDKLASVEAQVLELQTLKLVLETDVAGKRASISCQARENDELRLQVQTWQQKCGDLEAQLRTMKAQVVQQEEQLSSLEEHLDRAEAEALQLMVNSKPNRAKEECENLRSEVERLKNLLATKTNELKEGENNQEILTLKEARDEARSEVQALHEEIERAQSRTEVYVNEKDEEAKQLETLVSTLQNQNSALEKQLEVVKLESSKLRQTSDGFAMEVQGMKNRMTMMQAAQSAGSRDVKGIQAAQAANVDLQRRLEEKETEVCQLYKRMATLQSENEAQASRLDGKASELEQAHQELDELHCQCHDKDAQLRELKEMNRGSEKLTQDVMRDLHKVKFDISKYAALVNQQKLELISERSRHSDEAQEKDDEISNLQAQLTQERQAWMLQMNHKQAEMVVARVLSEKMRLKNKNLSAEIQKLKADCTGKKKKLKLLEQQLKELAANSRRVSTESEGDFDEVQQFQALLARANDTSVNDWDADFDEKEHFQALLAQANDAQRQ